MLMEKNKETENHTTNKKKSNMDKRLMRKLHIVMDPASFARFTRLKGMMEAASDAEVIRRSLRMYELCTPDDIDTVDDDVLAVGPSHPNPLDTRDIWVHLPASIFDVLRKEKENGMSYSDTVRHALRVATQLARVRDNLVSQIRTGDSCPGQSSETPKSTKVDSCESSISNANLDIRQLSAML